MKSENVVEVADEQKDEPLPAYEPEAVSYYHFHSPQKCSCFHQVFYDKGVTKFEAVWSSGPKKTQKRNDRDRNAI